MRPGILTNPALAGQKPWRPLQLLPITNLAGMIDGGVSRGEKMLYSGIDPESYITEYTFVYEEKHSRKFIWGGSRGAPAGESPRSTSEP